IEEEGRFSERARDSLFKFYAHSDYSVVTGLMFIDRLAEEAAADPGNTSRRLSDMDGSQCKQLMLDTIDREIDRLTEARAQVKSKEKLELQAESMVLSIPDADAANTLLRYETTIERQLYRALNQLERLQRARQGDAVPPPIHVELSADT
ncbi:MAG: hypothetical protein ABIJ61_12595, partial [bacterium]